MSSSNTDAAAEPFRRVAEGKFIPLNINAGERSDVQAIATARAVRVECSGQSFAFPNRLEAGEDPKRFYRFIPRQKSKAEFEDFRLRVLREQ